MTLTAAALGSRPLAAASLPLCHPPACFIGPGCCVDRECYSFCQSLWPGSIPHCTDPEGGCCSCEIVG
jgi:hypothetical protein